MDNSIQISEFESLMKTTILRINDMVFNQNSSLLYFVNKLLKTNDFKDIMK